MVNTAYNYDAGDRKSTLLVDGHYALTMYRACVPRVLLSSSSCLPIISHVQQAAAGQLSALSSLSSPVCKKEPPEQVMPHIDFLSVNAVYPPKNEDTEVDVLTDRQDSTEYSMFIY